MLARLIESSAYTGTARTRPVPDLGFGGAGSSRTTGRMASSTEKCLICETSAWLIRAWQLPAPAFRGKRVKVTSPSAAVLPQGYEKPALYKKLCKHFGENRVW